MGSGGYYLRFLLLYIYTNNYTMVVLIAIVALVVFAGLLWVSLKLYKALIEGKFENKREE